MVKTRKSFPIILLWIVILGFMFGVIFFNNSLTGRVILESSTKYVSGENLEGVLKIALKQGELIPGSTKVVFENGNTVKEYILSDIISEQGTSGDFYIRGASFSGNGEGYGIKGGKTSYPKIYFQLETSSIQNSENPSEENINNAGNENTPAENNNQETPQNTETNQNNETSNNETTPEENVTETTNENEATPNETASEKNPITETTETNQDPSASDTETSQNAGETQSGVTANEETTPESSTQDSTTEIPATEENQNTETTEQSQDTSANNDETPPATETESSNPGITGNVALSIGGAIDGEFLSNKEFTYTLNLGETAKLVSGSVKTDSKNLSDSDINIKITGTKVVVTSDYSEIEEGFGKDFTGSEEKNIEINFSKIDFKPEAGNLKISLNYEDEEIVSVNTQLLEGITTNSSQETFETPVNENLAKQYNAILTENETKTLFNEFGNQSLKITKAEKTANEILIRFELGDYWAEHYYSQDLSDEELKIKVDEEKTQFLKDLANRIIEDKSTSKGETLKDFLGSYEIKPSEIQKSPPEEITTKEDESALNETTPEENITNKSVTNETSLGNETNSTEILNVSQ